MRDTGTRAEQIGKTTLGPRVKAQTGLAVGAEYWGSRGAAEEANVWCTAGVKSRVGGSGAKNCQALRVTEKGHGVCLQT